MWLSHQIRLRLSWQAELHCSLLQSLVARCPLCIRAARRGMMPVLPAALHKQALQRHAAAIQGYQHVSCPAGRVPSLPAADADGALPQGQEGAGQEAVEDQALPAVLRRPNLLTLQLPADDEQRLWSTQRADKAIQMHACACRQAQSRAGIGSAASNSTGLQHTPFGQGASS